MPRLSRARLLKRAQCIKNFQNARKRKSEIGEIEQVELIEDSYDYSLPMTEIKSEYFGDSSLGGHYEKKLLFSKISFYGAHSFHLIFAVKHHFQNATADKDTEKHSKKVETSSGN